MRRWFCKANVEEAHASHWLINASCLLASQQNMHSNRAIVFRVGSVAVWQMGTRAVLPGVSQHSCGAKTLEQHGPRHARGRCRVPRAVVNCKCLLFVLSSLPMMDVDMAVPQHDSLPNLVSFHWEQFVIKASGSTWLGSAA